VSPEHIDILAPSLQACYIAFDSDLLYRGLRSGQELLPGEEGTHPNIPDCDGIPGQDGKEVGTAIAP
jgi:hypothetical protein